MNTYIKSILPYLKAETCNAQELQDQLYRCYQKLHPYDSETVRNAFSQLDSVLHKLTLQEYDRVWDLTCDISMECERTAFLEGLSVGIRLSFGEDVAQ